MLLTILSSSPSVDDRSSSWTLVIESFRSRKIDAEQNFACPVDSVLIHL